MAETCNQVGKQHRVTSAQATKARRGETVMDDPESYGVPPGDLVAQNGSGAVREKVRVALAKCRVCGKYVDPDDARTEVVG
jgi:hypothetical protein